MTAALILALGRVGEPGHLLLEVQRRLHGRLRCAYYYPQANAAAAGEFGRPTLPPSSGPLGMPEPLLGKQLAQVSDSTVVLDLDNLLFTQRYEHLETDARFLVPEFVRRSWSKEQREWLDSECRLLPAVSLDKAKQQGRDLVEALVERRNQVILCDAIERAGELLPDGYATADDLLIALMELNLFARTLSAELGALIMHVNMGVRSAIGGATAIQTDFRRGGTACAEIIAVELERTLDQITEEDWFEQEKVRVKEKMNA